MASPSDPATGNPSGPPSGPVCGGLPDWFDLVADPPAVSAPDLAAWWLGLNPVWYRYRDPLDRAVAAGLHADRMAYAFAAGYQAALERLLAGTAFAERIGLDAPAALCVTEADGGHPRAIRTRLEPAPGGDGWRLTGEKAFATGIDRARLLLVAASTGWDEAGRNRLRLAAVPVDAGGVTVDLHDSTPFAPELRHGSVVFDGVAVAAADLLPGDGYAEYVKPFRTVEDAHVMAAAAGYLIAAARRAELDPAVVEQLLAATAALGRAAAADPREPGTHLLLAGCLELFRGVEAQVHAAWSAQGRSAGGPDPGASGDSAAEWKRYERDRALYGVAGRARAARRRKAWAEWGVELPAPREG